MKAFAPKYKEIIALRHYRTSNFSKIISKDLCRKHPCSTGATTHIFKIVCCFIAQIEKINHKYYQFT